jgi:hypothetical protein
MNAKRRIRRSRGYISYVMVLSIGAVLTMLMVYAYRDASQSMVVASSIQQRADYLNKEDAALRSMLSIVPNRAIRAMQSGSSATEENSTPLTWQAIFQEALIQANAGTSISAAVIEKAKLDTTYSGNTGDSAINNVGLVFKAVSPETGFVASGCSDLGTNFPPALDTSDVNTAALDKLYPIISSSKYYGAYASGRVGLSVTDYPQFNLIPYPNIDFGYGTQGADFVAKRNWWAFSVNLYNHNNVGTSSIDQSRDYVLSIYEIPSQLSISSNAFTSIGEHASGEAWQNISVEGRIYASKAQVEGASEHTKLSSRRGMSLSTSSKIAKSFTNNPFTPGLRETYYHDSTTMGTFYPVSLSSETGRAAFVPINRETEFYDRFADGVFGTATSVISPTNWNDYSVGALQCAMKLDVTDVVSSTDQTPKKLLFTYKKGGVDKSEPLDVDPTAWATATPQVPFDVTVLSGNRPCVVIKPELFAAYLAFLGADSLSVNSSIAVNANYRDSTVVKKPTFPCIDSDIGLILTDCTDLTSFTKGFSVVTNFRLYIADDFNIVSTTPPSGITGTFFPPASLYAPERRFGSADEPWKVLQAGTVGSLASDDSTTPIRPFDLKTGGGAAMAADKISVNLKPITHPGALPPITMMNWLIVLEEKRK